MQSNGTIYMLLKSVRNFIDEKSNEDILIIRKCRDFLLQLNDNIHSDTIANEGRIELN